MAETHIYKIMTIFNLKVDEQKNKTTKPEKSTKQNNKLFEVKNKIKLKRSYFLCVLYGELEMCYFFSSHP